MAEENEQAADTSRRSAPVYTDIPGFCKPASLDEIAGHDYVLTPGRYMGAPEEEDDGVTFAEKMEVLTAELGEQFEIASELETQIRLGMTDMGYEL